MIIPVICVDGAVCIRVIVRRANDDIILGVLRQGQAAICGDLYRLRAGGLVIFAQAHADAVVV